MNKRYEQLELDLGLPKVELPKVDLPKIELPNIELPKTNIDLDVLPLTESPFKGGKIPWDRIVFSESYKKQLRTIIESTIIGEEHLGENLKRDCLTYLAQVTKEDEDRWKESQRNQ